jgi:hypothetical protein
MNKKQQWVLIAAAALITITFFFPPTYTDEYRGHDEIIYRWIFGSWAGRVEVLLLLAEWVAICLLSGIGWLLFGDRYKSK